MRHGDDKLYIGLLMWLVILCLSSEEGETDEEM